MNLNMVKQLAGLMYYKKVQPSPNRKSFENLSVDEQKPYLEEVIAILAMLSKMNMVVAPKVDQEKKLADDKNLHMKNVGILSAIVQSFVKKLSHPKGIDKTFTKNVCDELAHRILDCKIT